MESKREQVTYWSLKYFFIQKNLGLRWVQRRGSFPFAISMRIIIGGSQNISKNRFGRQCFHYHGIQTISLLVWNIVFCVFFLLYYCSCRNIRLQMSNFLNIYSRNWRETWSHLVGKADVIWPAYGRIWPRDRRMGTWRFVQCRRRQTRICLARQQCRIYNSWHGTGNVLDVHHFNFYNSQMDCFWSLFSTTQTSKTHHS